MKKKTTKKTRRNGCQRRDPERAAAAGSAVHFSRGLHARLPHETSSAAVIDDEQRGFTTGHGPGRMRPAQYSGLQGSHVGAAAAPQAPVEQQQQQLQQQRR